MTTVRATIEMARSALLGGQAEEALAPCQAVLERYPRHLEANCLIAEARRELRQLPEAADLFERALAADPESLIGHWGLSTILEEQGDLAGALYELECAWDVSPSHRALREELLRLRGTLGTPGEPELAPIGLARVYARGFQWRRAVAELRRALEAQPERLDARVLLAECLWHLSRPVEAAEAAAEALVESPDCLKANLIRGYAQLAQGGRGVEEGRKLLGRALALDPECALAPKLFPGQALPPPLVEADLDLEADPPALLLAEPPVARALSLRDLADAAPAVLSTPPVEAEGEAATMRVIRPAPIGNAGRAAALLVGAGEVEPAATAPAAVETGRPAEAEAPPVVEAAAPVEPVELDEPEAESLPAVASAPVDEPVPAIEPAATVEPEPETVPTWMARPAAGAPAGGVHGLDPTLYAEWADLLGESVELDLDAATRLEEALAEATGGHATSGAWREVVLGSPESLEGASRGRAGRESGQPAGSAESGAAAASRDQDPPAEADAVPVGPQPSLEEQLDALGTLAAMGQIEEVAEAYRALLRARADAAPPAIEALTLLVVSHPDSAALHRALGDAYMRAGRFQKAIEAYNRAVASQPQPVAAA